MGACPCSCSSALWRCKLPCGCQMLVMLLTTAGPSRMMAAQALVTRKRTASRALLNGSSLSVVLVVVAQRLRSCWNGHTGKRLCVETWP
jgi:hypothetical protein